MTQGKRSILGRRAAAGLAARLAGSLVVAGFAACAGLGLAGQPAQGAAALNGSTGPGIVSVVQATATAFAALPPAPPPAPPTPPSAAATPTVNTAVNAVATREGQIRLADTYLAGGDFETAARIYSYVASQDPGNADALAGLSRALAARATATAEAAPKPTPAPETLLQAASGKWHDLAATALSGLLMLLALYVLAQIARWLLFAGRELWLMRIRPLLGRPAVPPGFIIGEFADHTGIEKFQGGRVVTQALIERLLAWNQLIEFQEVPVQPAPSLEIDGVAWLKVFWSWLLPPPRGFRVTGALLQDQAGQAELTVQRISLRSNTVDSGQTYASPLADREEAFRSMASEAAKWLLRPADMAAPAALAAPATTRTMPAAVPALPASAIFDQVLDLLLPVRQQVNHGMVDTADARRRLEEAQGMLGQLSPASSLRHDLERVVADLRKAMPKTQ